jgi:hypothetical protein
VGNFYEAQLKVTAEKCANCSDKQLNKARLCKDWPTPELLPLTKVPLSQLAQLEFDKKVKFDKFRRIFTRMEIESMLGYSNRRRAFKKEEFKLPVEIFRPFQKRNHLSFWCTL